MKAGNTNERGKLIVITDKDELVGEAKRSDASWERDLRSFVDDTHVEATFQEDGPV